MKKTVVYLTILLAGCATTHTPPKPSVDVPAEWDGSVNVAAAVDLSTWWQQFNDPLLTAMVNEALTANPDVKRASAALRQARALRQSTATDALPSVSLSDTRSVNRTDGGDTLQQHSAGIDASWEPDVFGAYSNATRAALADERAAATDLASTQASLVAEVALNYVDLRLAQSLLTITHAQIVRQEETYQLTEWRELAGLVSALDVAQARTSLEQLRAQVPSRETSVTEAERRLAVLAGKPPAALRDTFSTNCAIPGTPQNITISIPAEALRQRPDVRAAEQRVVAAAARLDAARAERYPRLRFSGSISVDPETLSSASLVRALVGSLTAPLFDRRRIGYQIDYRGAAEEEAIASLESTLLTALEEVENAITAYRASQRRFVSLSAAVTASRTAADLARDRYASGLVSYQIVLDTERSVLSAEQDLASCDANTTSAIIRLYRAVGGGWKESES